MLFRPKQALLRVTLALYCIYAVSPIYLSAMIGRDHLAAAGDRSVTVGIVWVNVILSSFADTHEGAAATAALQADEEGRKFILIRKKRALSIETYKVRPFFEELYDVALGVDRPEPRSCVAEVAPRLRIRHTDIPLSHHLGLSPPFRSA